MLRKSIIAIAAAATLGGAALTSSPASAHWGGWSHHFGGFHHAVFFRPSVAFHRPFLFRRHFALIAGPIFVDDGCWRVRRVPTFWGWRWRRVWVCG
jgi:hypothetical protein